jgi:hypothetical protein
VTKTLPGQSGLYFMKSVLETKTHREYYISSLILIPWKLGRTRERINNFQEREREDPYMESNILIFLSTQCKWIFPPVIIFPRHRKRETGPNSGGRGLEVSLEIVLEIAFMCTIGRIN